MNFIKTIRKWNDCVFWSIEINEIERLFVINGVFLRHVLAIWWSWSAVRRADWSMRSIQFNGTELKFDSVVSSRSSTSCSVHWKINFYCCFVRRQKGKKTISRGFSSQRRATRGGEGGGEGGGGGGGGGGPSGELCTFYLLLFSDVIYVLTAPPLLPLLPLLLLLFRSISPISDFVNFVAFFFLFLWLFFFFFFFFLLPPPPPSPLLLLVVDCSRHWTLGVVEEEEGVG